MAATNVLPPLSANGSLTASPQQHAKKGVAVRRAGASHRGKRGESPSGQKEATLFPTDVDPSRQVATFLLKSARIYLFTFVFLLLLPVVVVVPYVVAFACSYHNTALHNLCTDLLEKGFHLSFIEIFNLVEKQRLQHKLAGPAAILLGPLIEYDSPTLDELERHLKRAEVAKRSGDLDTVYACQRGLAQRFVQSKNSWLSDHFYERCLETALLVKGDSRKKEGEAHCFLGEAWEKRGMESCCVCAWRGFLCQPAISNLIQHDICVHTDVHSHTHMHIHMLLYIAHTCTHTYVQNIIRNNVVICTVMTYM